MKKNSISKFLKKVDFAKKKEILIFYKNTIFKKVSDFLNKEKVKIKAVVKLISESDSYPKVKDFLLFVFGYGLIINYALHFIFGIKFSILTLPAWGIMYYFIREEFIDIKRKLVVK